MTLIKILVELNARKYAIYVEPNQNSLRNICLEISRQTKHLVSFETQLFEIFDKDFDEFVVISDADQLIEQLSKIRIKDKTDDTNRLPTVSVGQKSVSDYNSVIDSTDIKINLNQWSGYSAEMTNSWVKNIAEIPDSIDNSMIQTFVKPLDSQSQRSYGRSSVKSSGLRSYTSEVVNSSTVKTSKSKTMTTTVRSDSQQTTISVKPIKDIDSFCDYLFDTNPSKSVINPNNSLATKRTVPTNRPLTSMSTPIRCKDLEEFQCREQSSVDPNKWFMNFSKEKNTEKERVDTNPQFFRQTNDKKLVNDFKLDLSNEDNTEPVPLLKNTSSPQKLNNPSIGSINEWLFDSKGKQSQRTEPNIKPNSGSTDQCREQPLSSSEIFGFPQNKTKQLNNSEAIASSLRSPPIIRQSVTASDFIWDQPLDMGPIDVDQCPETVSAPVNDQSPATKLKKAMDSIKQKRLIEELSPNETKEPKTRIVTNDFNSFNSYLFESDSDVLTKFEVKQNDSKTDFFDQKPRSHSDIPIDINQCFDQTMNIPSDSDTFELNFKNCDDSQEYNLNSNDIKDVHKEVIPENNDLMNPFGDQTLVDTSTKEMIQIIKRINNLETDVNSYEICDNYIRSIWSSDDAEQSEDSSEPTLILSPNESEIELNSELNISIRTPPESEGSINGSEEHKSPTNDSQTIGLNVANVSDEQKVLNNSPEEHSIDIPIRSSSSSEPSFAPFDWESDPDLKRIKINSFELFGESEPIKQILNLFDTNKTRFAKNPTTDPSDTSKWKIISEEMVKRGHKNWNHNRCKTTFLMAYRLYKESLQKCPDLKTALTVYPLFIFFHSVDLRFILTSEQFKQLEESKDVFKKNNSRERYPSGCSAVVELEDAEPIIDKIAIESTKLEKIRKMTEEKINLFKVMVDFMAETTKEYGEVSKVKNFWELVTGLMKVNGFRIYDEKDFCQQFFRECVNDYYSLVLIHSPDLLTAQKVYRLFEFIHELDLKSYLTKNSFKKIRKLRKEFAERIIKTSSQNI